MAEIRGTYNSTAPTLQDGQYGSIQLDSNGAMKVRLASAAGAFLDIFSGDEGGLYVQGNVDSGRDDAGFPIKMGGKYIGNTLNTFTENQRANIAVDKYGRLVTYMAGNVSNPSDGVTNVSLVSPSNDSDIAPSAARLWTISTFIFNGSTWDRFVKSNSVSRIASAAASTNATSAKGSAGNVHNIQAYNTSAAVKYLKLYNKATAPTVGTDTPVMTFAIGPSQQLSISFANGHYFSVGIAYALTGAAADADTTALTAGDVTGVAIAYS